MGVGGGAIGPVIGREAFAHSRARVWEGGSVMPCSRAAGSTLGCIQVADALVREMRR